jgi:Phage replication protein CRI
MTTIIDIKSVVFEELLKDESNNIKQYTNIDNTTGEIHNTYIIFDKTLSYIKYNDRSKRLFISLSIPKLLYGNNIKEINGHDIKEFFNTIHNRLNELLYISIDHEEWKISEVEISKNFHLDSQQQVTDYINKLSNIKLPRKTTIKYNSESVYFKNKSQIIKFYDKLQELKKEKGTNPELLKQVENVLRFEVQAKGYLLREFSPERKAVDLLTKEFFDSVTTEIIELINSKITLENKSIITPIIFDSGMTKNQIESSVAIMIFTNEMGESTIREVYSSSTLKRKQDNLKDLIQYVQQRQGTEQKQFLK